LKNYLIIVFCCMTTVFAPQAQPQTSTTELVIGAHWDDGTYVQGTVTLGQLTVSGPDFVIAAKTLSNGWTNVSEPLRAATMYNVTLLTVAGPQLVKFPITTAMINPGNLKRAEIDLIFRRADNSLKSANVTVSMAF